MHAKAKICGIQNGPDKVWHNIEILILDSDKYSLRYDRYKFVYIIFTKMDFYIMPLPYCTSQTQTFKVAYNPRAYT